MANTGNNNPKPRALPRNQPEPYPQKRDRAQIFNDHVGPLQSGAALRNRYEDGTYLPNQSPDSRRDD